MQKSNKKKANFVLFCIEMYADAKGMTGEEVFDYFKEHGVIQYLIDCYHPLNTQGSRWLIEDVDEYVSYRTKN